MIELHERLSEFSYGYGVTRDVQCLLTSVGVRTVPFMPSLLQEKQIGFDVGFTGSGVPLLLQFKLGQSLTRFVRTDVTYPPPTLDRPFFRFSLNTAEVDGQYETLLKAQVDGAEVYYVAPRFADWPHYVRLFEEEAVLENSVMVMPSEIREALIGQGLADGHHRVVYDNTRVHVCSKAADVRDVRPAVLAEVVLSRVHAKGATLADIVRRVYAGLEDRSAIRRQQPQSQTTDHTGGDMHGVLGATRVPELEQRSSVALTRTERSHRLTQLRERSRSEEDAIAAALGLEFWGLGIQLLFAVEQGAVVD
jgi:hypothetical protein